MVKIAIAGYGEISRQIVKSLLADGHHQITILGRKDAPVDLAMGVTWAKVDYMDKGQLVQALQGMHSVLSFINVVMDHENRAQINLINACVEAGVKRFAPSEWTLYFFHPIYGAWLTLRSYNVEAFPMYNGKRVIREYLKDLNKNGKVLEYCLFVPGVFMDYLGPPEKMQKGVSYTQLFLDFGERRAILPEDSDPRVTFTTLEDVAKTVANAANYEGEWPVMGGIAGNSIKISELLQLGERIRGQKFFVERIKLEDLKSDNYVTTWNPVTFHPSIPVEQREIAGREFARLSLIGLPAGGWDISDDWNQLLPNQKFVTIEDFLRNAWRSE